MDDIIEPRFQETYPTLFEKSSKKVKDESWLATDDVEYCELPLIDLSCLNFWSLGKFEEDSFTSEDFAQCIKEMAEAASDWGFFQVVNHGIPQKDLKNMLYEQKKLFHQPFSKKAEKSFMNFSANSYRWGSPTATCLRQFSWSEAFHIPLPDLLRLDECNKTRSSIGLFATKAASLAQRLAEYLANNLGAKSSYFRDNCLPSSSYVRMNRYPPCPLSFEVYGLMPHTDSDFLTILYQDQVGGLQLRKDGRWLGIKPNPEVLIINIGDLFQAFSNGVYKSIEHRVVARSEVERFSVAYFYCPSHEAVIENFSSKPAVYRKFSFKEYTQQVQKDVRATGDKVGLSRFLIL
ncbi:gibberellin 2-beta-dioxygenase 8-like [Mangifera indica]|uniref:gibberellin 2-beta-dioxygenase 8-like n=1 Tax=Mangifera indica TaxID=29780 RepID=UPI001CFB92D2|nr:gibberellin 2-beta-dioxygenase 8-like [Mangifera indica]XP_044474239.1 gibberellin 2-beta-dioxygenase 8-like [Mangifera indica]